MSPPPPSPSFIIETRFLSFLIWQSIQSTAIFILTKSFLLSPLTTNPFTPSLLTFSSLLLFLFSMLLFSVSIHNISTPQFRRPALPHSLALGLIQFLFTGYSSLSSNFLSRARSSLGIVLLVCVSAVSGFFAVVSISGSSCSCSFVGVINSLGIPGFGVGLIYGAYCVFSHRWVLNFPIVQRQPFFSYKMVLLTALRQALKLSATSLFMVALNYLYRNSVAGLSFFYIGSFAVLLSWELIFHLHKILHTKRCVFAPSKGSGAVETNPSEFLLIALEDSYPRSLLQYHAYLDLCMLCGTNVEPWRRAAFFEETGDNYKRVMAACLRPLEQFASRLAEGLAVPTDNINKLSHQLSSPNEISQSSEIQESFRDFQLYAWCAQAVASLEVRSHKEDRFGVAQLSGSHAMVLSTLLSCLLAVETAMGKKINLQSPSHILGPAGIKWATNSITRREIATAMNKKMGSPSHFMSYTLADVLKISIYSIVSEFHKEMDVSAKAGLLEKEWLSRGKPVYGSSELLLQKLHFFLNYLAS